MKTATITFTAVAAIAVGIGLYEALLTPAIYGVSISRAASIMDSRPWGWTIAWGAFATGLLGAALWRASALRRRGHSTVSVTLRGAIWVWAAIAGSWFYVWIVWDLQMFDVLELEPVTAGLPTIRIPYAVSALIALVIAPLWSSFSWLRARRALASGVGATSR